MNQWPAGTHDASARGPVAECSWSALLGLASGLAPANFVIGWGRLLIHYMPVDPINIGRGLTWAQDSSALQAIPPTAESVRANAPAARIPALRVPAIHVAAPQASGREPELTNRQLRLAPLAMQVRSCPPERFRREFNPPHEPLRLGRASGRCHLRIRRFLANA